MKAVDLGVARAQLGHLYLMLLLSPKTDSLTSLPSTPMLPRFNSLSYPSHWEMTHFFTGATGLGAQRCHAAPCLAYISAGTQDAAGNTAAPRAHRWHVGCLIAIESVHFSSSSPPASHPAMS